MSDPTSGSTQSISHRDLLRSAKIEYRDRNYHGAIADYTSAIAIHPDDALAICCRGAAYYKLGAGKNAMSDYNRSISLDPTAAITYYRRASLYYSIADYQNAIGDYNQAIKLQPDFAFAYSNRGYAYRELYGEQEALIDWRFAAKLFKEQGNLGQYQNTIDLIDRITGIDSSASGML
jgi:tetratricopeptide (TPR) repeat protein